MSRHKAIALRQLSPPFVGAATTGAAGDARYRRRPPEPATPSLRNQEYSRLHFHQQSNAIKYAALLFYLPAFVVLGLIIAN